MQARSMAAAAGSSLALAPAGVFIFFSLVAPGVAAEAAAPAPAPPGFEFRVGGPRGWRVPDANTSYGWWAMNNRFHVGDHLYFKYANDSVLVVDRRALDACNATEPLAAFTDGATRFRLHRPGFFCFISGEPGHCEEGQRLIVRVMVHPADVVPAETPRQTGHGGGGFPRPSGCSDASSGAAAETAIAATAGVAIVVVLTTPVALLLQ